MLKSLYAAGAAAAAFCALAVPAAAIAQYRHAIDNDLDRCHGGEGPAVRITVSGIKASRGTIRVQSYRATRADWLTKGRWINRIELPARAGSMVFCMPLPASGSYAIAVRHDINGNGDTDITQDGGGMSNNPSINVFNLGRPSVDKTAVPVGAEVKPITIMMKYMGS